MEGPRIPQENEFAQIFDFLNLQLRPQAGWSIEAEYPTALSEANRHNMRIIKDADQVLSHAVIKPLIVKSPEVIFKVAAIGSVVTHPAYRNQGLSSQIIRECLSESEKQNCDLAILWTDQFDFYRRFGFELAGTELSFIIDSFQTDKNLNLRIERTKKIDPEALLRIYSKHSVGAVRTVDDIRRFLQIPNSELYTAWESNGTLAAFAVTGKGADLTGYVHEWGGGIPALLSLVQNIRQNQKDQLVWMIPHHCTNLVKTLLENGFKHSQGYLGMLKIVNLEQLGAKLKRAFRARGIQDVVIETRDNSTVFGVGSELFNLGNPQELLPILFGPLMWDKLNFLSPNARAKLQTLLPIPLWLWGWDSI